MACGSQQKYGYEDSRFKQEVGESLHCPICFNVLKHPKMCVNNEHLFCQDCIITHLQNDSTCPECREELTVETLKPVSRVLMKCWSELPIKCEYFDRGCHGYLEVGNLDNHIMKCDFAPTQCSNDGCTVVVNKRDILHHEKEICQFRRVKCHECGELRNEISKLRKEFREQNDDVQANMNDKYGELRKDVGQLRQDFQTQNNDVKDEINEKLRQQNNEMKGNQEKMNNEFGQVKQQIKDVQVLLVEIFDKLTVDNVKGNLDEMKKSQEVMQEQLGQLPTKLNIVQQTILSSLHDEQASTKKDIIIAGGETATTSFSTSVERYSWDKGSWAKLPDMKVCRKRASCFVYQNQVFVAGGWCGIGERTDIIEVMNIGQEQLQQIFRGKLPTKLRYHKTVVYDNKLIVIGGRSGEGYSNNIYEILLTPPYSSKLLSKMTIPRGNYGVELVNNKVFILGGEKSFDDDDIVDNVCEYDVVKKEFREMPLLSYPVSEMSTVVWRSKIIVIGGEDRNRETLNKVMMYDVETGESEILPNMKYKRAGCAAVATGEGVVVMGGWNEKKERLKSVEYFNMSSRLWQELPSMVEPRSFACAVVKP